MFNPKIVFVDHAACQLLLQSIKILTMLSSELSIPLKFLNTELYKPLQAGNVLGKLLAGCVVCHPIRRGHSTSCQGRCGSVVLPVCSVWPVRQCVQGVKQD